MKRAALLCGTVIVLFAASFCGPLWVRGKTMSAFDMGFFHFSAYRALRPAELHRPSNGLLSDPVLAMEPWSIARLEGPLRFPWLWNPYSGCGCPMAANAQSAVFFPLSYLTQIAGVRCGFGVLAFLKLALAGLFTFAYLRRMRVCHVAALFGGLSFMACGFMIAWLQYPMTSAAVFLPLILMGCEDILGHRTARGMLVVVGAVGMSWLSGHPETTIHEVAIAGLYVLLAGSVGVDAPPGVRARLGHVGRALGVTVAAVVLGTFVAGVQVIPTAEYILQSTKLVARSTGTGHGLAGHGFWFWGWEYAWDELRSYLMPNSNGNPSLNGHWWNRFSNFNESAGYCGIGILWLAGTAWALFGKVPRIRAMVILQVLSLGVILGVTALLCALDVLPVLRWAAHKRLLLLLCLSNAVLAAMVLDRLWRGQPLGIGARMWGVTFAIVMVAAAFYDYHNRFAGNPYAWIPVFGLAQFRHFILFLAPFLAVLFMPRMSSSVRTLYLGALALVLALDLFLVHGSYNPFIKPDLMYPETAAIRYVQTQGAGDRVLPLDCHIPPNLLLVYGIEDVRVFDALIPSWVVTYLHALGGLPAWYIVRAPDMRLASLASVRWIWSDRKWSPPGADLALRFQSAESCIYENLQALPHAYVAKQWRGANSPEEALKILRAPEFPWRDTAVVEGQNSSAGNDPDATAIVRTPFVAASVTRRGDRRVDIRLPEATRGLLVLTDTYYPGWVARAGNRRLPIRRVNGMFRGVVVDENCRTVVFEYEPWSWRLGIMGSALGLALIVWLSVVSALRVRRSCRPSRRMSSDQAPGPALDN